MIYWMKSIFYLIFLFLFALLVYSCRCWIWSIFLGLPRVLWHFIGNIYWIHNFCGYALIYNVFIEKNLLGFVTLVTHFMLFSMEFIENVCKIAWKAFHTPRLKNCNNKSALKRKILNSIWFEYGILLKFWFLFEKKTIFEV